ncbi:protein of unknown function [Cupriavidus taiwanensis]|uniref:Uncharacterized protein n=1 Tax=Cupriavidus taiwanensis TaxID=164546 RepID=A0A375I9S9_9BURK|nr:protein of unknown function [Cupriavidus taiwanensis]
MALSVSCGRGESRLNLCRGCEFLVDTYGKSSREKLLEFLSAAEDFNQLRSLEQPRLAKEYSLRMAANIYAPAAGSPKAA